MKGFVRVCWGLQVFSYSHFNKEGEVGAATADALSARDVRWAKVKSEKAPVGVPAEPGPDLGIEYRYSWSSTPAMYNIKMLPSQWMTVMPALCTHVKQLRLQMLLSLYTLL